MSKRKTKPAVGYARRSTDMQERSIPDQKAYVEKWAAENGYHIVRWYVDDAISGTSTKGRNAFECLLTDSENGRDFESIICYDISRFSRGGTNETGYYLHRLNLVGVDVIFAADGIPEGDEGELIQGVKSWQARQYSVKLARDSVRGQLSNILVRRSAPGGPPPYGYDKQHLTPEGEVLRTLRWMGDGRKVEFDPSGKQIRVVSSNVYVAKAKGDIVRYVPSTPERVAAMQRMFDLCIQGYGIKAIAERFNNEGVPTMKGSKWNTSNIAMMLRAPVYRGALAYNKRTSGSLFGMDKNGNLRPKKGRRGNFKNANEDWIIVEGVHEPLVSPETFEAAQAAINKRRDAGGKARSVRRTLLSTLLVCKRCGMSFTTVRDHRRNPEFGDCYRHYTCSGYHRYGKKVCGLVRIPGPALDTFVLEIVKKAMLGDARTVKQAVDAFVAAATKKPERNGSDDGKQLEQIDRRIKATIKLLSDPTFDGFDDLHSVLTDLKRQRERIVKRTRAETTVTIPYTHSQLREWATARLQHLSDLADRTEVDLTDRQLVEQFVRRIEIEPETQTGTVYIYADLAEALASTRVQGGDHHQTAGSGRGAAAAGQTDEGI